jgi:large subunit ribosomal protein L19
MKAKKFTKETIRDLGVSAAKFPHFREGDTVAVSLRIKDEGGKEVKERIQVFEGDVIAIRRAGASSVFTVRKIGANAVAVERILPFHSPLIEKIKVVRRGNVRRAKLYYMRSRIGKAARVEELVMTRAQREQEAQKDRQ